MVRSRITNVVSLLAVAILAMGCVIAPGDGGGGSGGGGGGNGGGGNGGGGSGNGGGSGGGTQPPTQQCVAGVGAPTTCSAAKFALASAVNHAAHGAYPVATADMNCDGYDDIVTGNPNEGTSSPDNKPTVGVLLNQGDGTFADMVQYDATSTTYGEGYAGAIALGDLDGDGFPDVVAFGGDLGASPFYMLNDGTGKLSPPVALAFAPNDNAENQISIGSTIILADMNGDGWLDIVIQSSMTEYVVVIMNEGGGTFAPNVDYDVYEDAPNVVDLGGMAVADFNGDGKPDVAVLDDNNDNISFLMNTGNGGLAAPTHMPVTNPGTSGDGENRLVAADFNGDGKTDLAFSNQRTNITVALNQGNGAFKESSDLTVPNQYGVQLITTDLDHDGHPDLVLTQGTDGTAQVLLNEGSGTFAAPLQLSLGASMNIVASGNFTGDGVDGLVVSSYDDIDDPDAPAPNLYTYGASCSP
jgi:FG-GAP-like repeat